MYWWLGTIIGGIFMIILATLQRKIAFGITPYLPLFFILAILSNLGNWYGYYYTNNFMFCWLLGSAYLAITNVVIDILFFGKEISIQLIFGIFTVLGGLILIKLS